MPSLSAVRATARRPSSPIRGWKAPTASAIPTSLADGEGMGRLFRQFSFPGGVPSHTSPQTPGSIHEGGELGYSLSHAFGAAFDNPDLVVACVVGDGEAETGPAATGWHSNKFLDPCRDGVVLPILHLNGYKIAAPTVLARIPTFELLALFTGYGYHPVLVEGGFDGESPMAVHQRMAAALDEIFAEIQRDPGLRSLARCQGSSRLAHAHLAHAQGLDGPKVVDGLPIEGTFRAHQIPMAEVRTNPDHLAQLEAWLRSYRPEELFDEVGCARPGGHLRLSTDRRAAHERQRACQWWASCWPTSSFPTSVTTRSTCRVRELEMHEATRVLGSFLRDAMAANPSTFRLFGPDETSSNRLQNVFEVTDRTWEAESASATTTWPPMVG
jgi:xylulose-5-phosphate/fructose-6-phosphate phosphoketolase